MPKNRKKINKSHLSQFKKRIKVEMPEAMKEFDYFVKLNGWASTEARIFAFIIDYNHFNKKEPLEFEGD